MLRNLSTRTMAKLAVGQINSTANISHNLSQCVKLVKDAAKAGAKALFLPEASDYISTSPGESISLSKFTETKAFLEGVQAAARANSIAVNVGIHAPTEDGKRVKNLLVWINEQGNVEQQYQKIHMFDVDISNGPRLKESDSVEPGTMIIPPFKTAVGNVGLLICFDLRFPEPSLRLIQSNPSATLITYPSAFTVPTGKAHWSPLLRVRAIENQCYVVAAAQVGQHNEKRQSYGHSMVIDPWGEILIDLSGEWSGEPELGICEVSAEQVEAARRQIPLKRRWDVYGRC